MTVKTQKVATNGWGAVNLDAIAFGKVWPFSGAHGGMGLWFLAAPVGPRCDRCGHEMVRAKGLGLGDPRPECDDPICSCGSAHGKCESSSPMLPVWLAVVGAIEARLAAMDEQRDGVDFAVHRALEKCTPLYALLGDDELSLVPPLLVEREEAEEFFRDMYPSASLETLLRAPVSFAYLPHMYGKPPVALVPREALLRSLHEAGYREFFWPDFETTKQRNFRERGVLEAYPYERYKPEGAPDVPARVVRDDRGVKERLGDGSDGERTV